MAKRKQPMVADMPMVLSPEMVVAREMAAPVPAPADMAAEVPEEDTRPMDKKRISEARETMLKYKAAKAPMDTRIVTNEAWWQLRHLDRITRDLRKETDTPSAWLFNSIANKHADFLDNAPSCSVLPREASDRQTAEKLSSVVPVILEQNDFEQVYSDACDYKLKNGMCCYRVGWDTEMENGLGNVSVDKVDILNLFWEPGITDIQKSRNVFYLYMMDTDLLEARYPEYEGKLGGITENVVKYAYTAGQDTSNKTAVIDWYYKVRNADGRTVLHMCTFAGDYVLYATENDPELAESGLYDHGKYPFVIDRLFGMEGTLESFGYIDVMKGVQTRIDRQQTAITSYMQRAARLRWFKRDNCGINVEQYMDLTQDFVDVTDGRFDEENLRQIKVDPIDGIWVQVMNNNIEELKAVSGNSDVSQGTASGQMAASAVAALQEAAGKLSRDMIKATYRAFREICLLIIECMRQFYTEERMFRITEPDGGMAFVGIKSAEMRAFDRLPIYDVVVKAQKASAYSQMARNELVKELYNMGFFAPQQADVSISCLKMMDFDGKEEMIQMLEKNGTMYNTIQTLQTLTVQLTQIADPDGSEGILDNLLQSGLLNAPGQQQMGGGMSEDMLTNSLGGAMKKNNLAEKAKSETQDMSAPR